MTLFKPRSLVAMVHVHALPGAPASRRGIAELAGQAAQEATLLRSAARGSRGFDAIIIENMHDRPYVHGTHGPHTVAAMTRIGAAVRDAAGDMPLGVQVLSGGNREALAIALAIGGAFIRCENFVYSHVADEGLLDRAEAGPLMRYRRSIGADHVRVLCDIKKKHASHALTADISVGDAAEGAIFFGADGLIVTGTATGRAVAPQDLVAVRAAGDAAAARGPRVPVLVGSGVTPGTLESLWMHADALIVGSWFKADGHWANDPDPARIDQLLASAAAARSV